MVTDSQTVIGELAQRKRDALVATWTGSIAPDKSGVAVQDAATADDLYSYLLIDSQVAYNVKTSVIAETIASLQQYINNILCATEPGYSTIHWTEGQYFAIVNDWLNINGQYDTWAANAMLSEYPENYLMPPLRQRQTYDFQKLVSALNQGPLNGDTALAAIQDYLNRFEEVANLTVLSGYMDTTDSTVTGKVHILGCTPTSPTSYYLRSCDLTDCDENGYPLVNSWSDWEKIDLLRDNGNIIGIPRLVLQNERIYVTWFERAINTKNNQSAGSATALSITITAYAGYRKFDGTWSASQVLDSKTSDAIDKADNKTLFRYSTTSGVRDPVFSTVAFQYTPENGQPRMYSILFTDSDIAKNDKTGEYSLTGCVNSLSNVLNAQGSSAVLTDIYDLFDGEKTVLSTTVATNYTAADKCLVNKKLTRQSRLQTAAQGPAEDLASDAIAVQVTHTEELEEPTLLLKTPLAAVVADDGVNSKVPDSNVIYLRKLLTAPGTKTAHVTFQPGQMLQPETGVIYDFSYSDSNGSLTGWYSVDIENWTAEVQITLSPEHKLSFATESGSDRWVLPQLWFKEWDRKENNREAGAQFYTDKVFPTDPKILHVRLSLPPGFITPSLSAREEFSYDIFLIRFTTSDNVAGSDRSEMLNVNCYSSTFPINNGPGVKHTFSVSQNTRRATEVDYSVVASLGSPIAFNQDGSPIVSSNWVSTQGKQTWDTSDTNFTRAALSPSDTFPMSFVYKGSGEDLYLGIVTTRQGDKSVVASNWRRAFWKEEQLLTIDNDVFPVVDDHTDSALGTAQMLNLLTNTIPSKETGGGSSKAYPLIRMNTTFAATLVNAANQGLDELYSWATQITDEPPLVDDEDPIPQMDFHGANSIYFWELFYHTPVLLAYTLYSQGNYGAALVWLQRIFDPGSRNQQDSSNETSITQIPDYWKIVPVAPPLKAGTKPPTVYGSPTDTAIDPYAIAYREPTHFRKAIYADYMRILIAIGDMYYRRLTPDGLNQALQCYTRVNTLLGTRPSNDISSFPSGVTLGGVAAPSGQAVRGR